MSASIDMNLNTAALSFISKQNGITVDEARFFWKKTLGFHQIQLQLNGDTYGDKLHEMVEQLKAYQDALMVQIKEHSGDRNLSRFYAVETKMCIQKIEEKEPATGGGEITSDYARRIELEYGQIELELREFREKYNDELVPKSLRDRLIALRDEARLKLKEHDDEMKRLVIEDPLVNEEVFSLHCKTRRYIRNGVWYLRSDDDDLYNVDPPYNFIRNMHDDGNW